MDTGIFRRPAGARAVRELRDSLDAGEFHLPLTRDHIFVIAGVFKDFLRSIPGSLLCCELYEEWIDVLEEEEEEKEQVQDIKRMICRLPKENALLLRYLLAVLYGIQGNALENQMTSFNLSVCIAPSMLWPPGAPCSPEVEGEGAKKVCELVKFMIEHCRQVLGEDPSSLFGGPPQRRNDDEMGLDSWLYPLTDSSYDSLENELDNSSGGSPGFCSREVLPSKPLRGSLDSIITFSDCDQDPDTRHTQAAPTRDSSSTLDSLCLDGLQQQRRRSEPAIAYVAKLQPCFRSSTENLAGEEHISKKPSTPGQTMRRDFGRCVTLEASLSSLSSTPTFPPPPMCSSPDSLDSLGVDRTCTTRWGLPSNCTSAPKDSTPKEPLSWGTLKGCRGLHPNSWLRKDRRLSLTQQDNLEKDEDKTGVSVVSIYIWSYSV
ncbi:hypothetical protein INR49_026114 [Caranx melampygus]|nr:hypothetical protein INR49_026114 [Caranx melampygus]